MHIYTSSHGAALPSVTEIIGKTTPLAETIKMNAAIEKKKEREGLSNKDWELYMKAAQDRGTNCHHFMEVYFPIVEEANSYVLDGREVPESLLKKMKALREFWEADAKIGDYVKQLTKFSRDLNRQTRDWSIISSEEVLVNEELGYGGRSDALFRIGDNHILIDLKTNAGYWSSWKQCQCYGWNEWRKPKKEPVMYVKQYANGKSKELKKKDATGRVVTKEEEIPPVAERGWDWVDSKIKSKFLQLCMYIMAARDMKSSGKLDYDIHNAAILVAFPQSYQFIKLPTSVWAGCKEEAISRIEEYRERHLDKWKLEVSLMKS
jgi:hypothetical protein